MSNLVDYAERELRAAGLFDSDSDYDGAIGPAVLELVKTLSGQEHSGFGHGLVMSVFNRVANFKPLSPLTDNPAEWMEIDAGKMWQSNRNHEAFSTDGGKSYYLLSERMYLYACACSGSGTEGFGEPDLQMCNRCGKMETIVRYAQPDLTHVSKKSATDSE